MNYILIHTVKKDFYVLVIRKVITNIVYIYIYNLYTLGYRLYFINAYIRHIFRAHIKFCARRINNLTKKARNIVK